MVTLNGKIKYPDTILEDLSGRVKTHVIEGTNKAIELGLDKVMNIIMLGALSRVLNLDNLNWEKAIRESVKPQYIDINLKAFNIGQNQI